MTQQDALNLIEKAISPSEKPQFWADLGCGSGTFTHALAELLPKSSKIFAVDSTLQRLPEKMGSGEIEIEFIQAGFEKTEFRFSNLDGILMANSLHYIEDKKSLLLQLERYLTADKKFLIVEYDTRVANQWVPYPVGFTDLTVLFKQVNNFEINKIAERKSIFGQGNLYAAVISSINK